MSTASEPRITHVEYEMGYAADEFGNVLCGPFTGGRSDFDVKSIGRHRWQVMLDGAAFDLVIDVDQRPPRQLGLLTLPVLAVKFTFSGTDDTLHEQFFARFHQYFHKGGG